MQCSSPFHCSWRGSTCFAFLTQTLVYQVVDTSISCDTIIGVLDFLLWKYKNLLVRFSWSWWCWISELDHVCFVWTEIWSNLEVAGISVLLYLAMIYIICRIVMIYLNLDNFDMTNNVRFRSWNNIKLWHHLLSHLRTPKCVFGIMVY